MNNLYADAFNEAVFEKPGTYLTRALVYFDNRGLDGLVNGLAALVGGSSGRLRRTQTGFVRSYALSMLGGALLVVPGFVTDALGALLIARPTRTLTRRWLSRRYAGRTMSFVAATGRFASGYRDARPADVESTALEDDADQLGR